MTARVFGLRVINLLAAAMLLAACGGSSNDQASEGGMGGSGSGSGGGQYAEGGMGGSGSGTASGYGSIYVNDNRHYPIDPNADVFLDGERVDPALINPTDKGLPLGITLEFLLAGDASPDLTSGTAIRIRADHRVIGPVTATQPLEVMGQPVLVTSETVLDGLTSGEAKNLTVGEVVKLDGLRNANGIIRATRLEQPSTPPAQWQLIGRVSSADMAGFDIKDQRVDLNGTPLEDCSGPLAGQSVLVRATPAADVISFAQNEDPLNTVLSVRCRTDGLSLWQNDPPEQKATLPATVDAIITGVPDLDPSDGEIMLDLNGQRVRVVLDQLVQLLLGTVEQLKLGSRIEVDGTLDTASGVITAESIRFRDPLITLTAPVDGGIVDQLLLTLGIEVRPTPEMQGVSLFQSPGSLGQVAVEGFITDSGEVYAESVSDQGSADASDVAFTGPVTAVSDLENTVTLLTGKVFDTASAESVGLVDAVGNLIGDLLCLLLCSSEPPDLEGDVSGDGTSVGQVTNASWNEVQSRFEDGELLIYVPDSE
jgi:hypothetical protein